MKLKMKETLAKMSRSLKVVNTYNSAISKTSAVSSSNLRYSKVGNTVDVSGWIRCNSQPAANAKLFSLPPAHTEHQIVGYDQDSHQMQSFTLRTNGDVEYYKGNIAGHYINFGFTYISTVGGVLRNPVIARLTAIFASLLFGGDVDETEAETNACKDVGYVFGQQHECSNQLPFKYLNVLLEVWEGRVCGFGRRLERIAFGWLDECRHNTKRLSSYQPTYDSRTDNHQRITFAWYEWFDKSLQLSRQHRGYEWVVHSLLDNELAISERGWAA